MPQSLITVNKNKLPNVAPAGTVFWAGDEGQAYVALPPDGKLMRIDRLENYVAQQRGPAGERGPQGPKGDDSQIPGPPGPAGPRGATGATGERGPRGERGFAGPRGEKGGRGDKGEPGCRGERGETGPRGEQGLQGLRGDVLYCTDAEVRAAAERLRDEKKRMLAALLRAKMAAGALVNEHSRRMTQHILATLEKDLK